MDCRIALRGVLSGRICTQTEKNLKPSDPLELSIIRYSICASGFSARDAGRRARSLQPSSLIFSNV
jgi:hypothetical protein